MKNSALLVLAAGGLGALIWTGFPGLEQVAEPATAEPASVAELETSHGSDVELTAADASTSTKAPASPAASRVQATAASTAPAAEAALPAEALLGWATELGAGGQMQGLLQELSQR